MSILRSDKAAVGRHLALVLVLVLAAGCSGGADEEGKVGGNNGYYGNNGGDNGGGEGGGSDDDFVPEQEEEFEFSAPAVVDNRIYVANETLNSVAVIDSESLAISTRQVGFRPTTIAGPDLRRAEPADQASVMVLNEGSHSVSVLATGSEAVATVPVMPRSNRLALDPTGRMALTWYDPEAAKASDPAGDLSSVSVVTAEASYQIAVGFHVREVVFDDAGQRALVLTDDGISKLDLANLSGDAVAPPTPVVPPEYQTSQPEDLEVLIGPDGNWAVTRSASFRGAVLLEIDTGKHHFLPLPEIPTDVDLIEGGQDDPLEVLIMLRGEAKALRATIPDGFSAAADAIEPPATMALSGTADVGLDAGTDAGLDAGDAGTDAGSDASLDAAGGDADLDAGGADAADTSDGGATDTGSSSDAASSDAGTGDAGGADADTGPEGPTFEFPTGIVGFEVIDVEVAGLGAASLAEDGQTALLYSTIGQEKRAVLFGLGDGEQRTLVFEKSVRGASSDRNGDTFLVYHSKVDQPIPDDATPADPEFIARSWGVSVVDVASAASRLVLTEHKPAAATLWAPDDGDAQIFLVFEVPEAGQAAQASHRDVLQINLRSFRTDSFRVPSLPEGLGPIRSAGRIYISQRHPQGRMTFVTVETGARQTITGYQLNAGID